MNPIKIPPGLQLRFDEHGHAIPFTEAEMRARAESLRICLEAMAAIPDDPPGSDEAFWRAIDAERPECPLFKELHEQRGDQAKEDPTMNPTETPPDVPSASQAGEGLDLNPTETSPKVSLGRRLQFDEHGHAIPLTEAEQEADTQAMLLALEVMAAIPDDPPGSDEAFWRAIDAERPERPLFKELYEK